jgi:hypothetical protein
MNAGNHNGMDELDYTTNVTKPENKTLIQKPKIKP